MDKHPQVRNPFEKRPPLRSEINAAREMCREAGPKCYALFEAREVSQRPPEKDSN